MSIFTYDYYRKSLETAIKKEYKFLMCKENNLIKNHNKVIVLRHDIDYSLENALKMALIESSLGLNATYFIRMHSKHYNPLEYKNYKIIKKIACLGHEIGFHQEPDFSNIFFENRQDEYVKNQIRCFADLFDVEVCGVSTHEPNRTGFQITKENLQYFNLNYEAYCPKLMSDVKYISDSGSRWREGDMLEWINKGESKLYVLTHPAWWYETTPLENY